MRCTQPQSISKLAAALHWLSFVQQGQGAADLVRGSQPAFRTLGQGQRFMDNAVKHLESGLLGG